MNTTPQSQNWIIETTQEHFERDVFERSKETPVVVDFWAAWCAPCKMLAPALEEAANEYAGKFILVKAETDYNQQAAAEFNVQSIPVVFGVLNAEVVDYFQGVVTPDQFRQWVDRIISHQALRETEALEDTDPAAAAQTYRQLLDASPDDEHLQIRLARALHKQGDSETAGEMLAALEARGFLEPEAQKLKAALGLEESTGNSDALQEAVAQNPSDHHARLDLAKSFAAEGDAKQALDQCLQILEVEKKGAGEEARKLMLDIFQVCEDPAVVNEYRKKLAATLY